MNQRLANAAVAALVHNPAPAFGAWSGRTPSTGRYVGPCAGGSCLCVLVLFDCSVVVLVLFFCFLAIVLLLFMRSGLFFTGLCPVPSLFLRRKHFIF